MFLFYCLKNISPIFVLYHRLYRREICACQSLLSVSTQSNVNLHVLRIVPYGLILQAILFILVTFSLQFYWCNRILRRLFGKFSKNKLPENRDQTNDVTIRLTLECYCKFCWILVVSRMEYFFSLLLFCQALSTRILSLAFSNFEL